MLGNLCQLESPCSKHTVRKFRGSGRYGHAIPALESITFPWTKMQLKFHAKFYLKNIFDKNTWQQDCFRLFFFFPPFKSPLVIDSYFWRTSLCTLVFSKSLLKTNHDIICSKSYSGQKYNMVSKCCTRGTDKSFLFSDFTQYIKTSVTNKKPKQSNLSLRSYTDKTHHNHHTAQMKS